MEGKSLSSLLNEYSERCADQRAKAEQYAKLWIYLLSILLLLASMTSNLATTLENDFLRMTSKASAKVIDGALSEQMVQKGEQGDDEGVAESFKIHQRSRLIIQAFLLVMILIIISLICYTHVTHSVLIMYLQFLEKKIQETNRHVPMWYTVVREKSIHPVNTFYGGIYKASSLLFPLILVIVGAVLICFYNILCITDDYEWFASYIGWPFILSLLLIVVILLIQRHQIKNIKFDNISSEHLENSKEMSEGYK